MKVIRTGFVLVLFSMAAFAADSEETNLNKEAPNILYVVPWTDAPVKKAKDPKLVLHNLTGDLYDPQIPSDW
ncbi:MAG: hypothetical protein B0W54_20585 [Cellvibrio sp. 79]|nr:MAG: hypothetical protein B0W54_20585 [Cellvibrio sp. 79]